MNKLTLLIFVFLSLAIAVQAQTPVQELVWKAENYKTVTHTNFRSQRIFNQKLPVYITKVDHALLNATLFFLTNEARVKNRLPPLEYCPALEIAAWNHALKMAHYGFISHDNLKDSHRRTIEDRAALAGITNPYLIESITDCDGSLNKSDTYLSLGQRLVNQLLQSEVHRKNLLSDSLQLGCGGYFYMNTWYAVQLFQSIEKIVLKAPADRLPTLVR